MKKLFNQKTFVYVILLHWLFVSAMGVHGHYCFDGAEPPASVHFNMLDLHDEDQDTFNKMHVDLDNNPSQTSAIKILTLDLFLFALAFLFVFVWPIACGKAHHFFNTPYSWLTPLGLRPPLRAPPINLH